QVSFDQPVDTARVRSALEPCSPSAYPCGCRRLELEARGNKVEVRSRFIQTRLLHLAEKSFYFARPQEVSETLGARPDRSFVASSGGPEIREKKWEMYPAPAPFWKSADSLNLAVLADTHLCLDKYFGKETHEDYHLIGHFAEEGSKALYRDVLGQVREGRHRLEFYDEVFAKEPDNRANYEKSEIDSLLICGDLAERGHRDEEQLVLEGLNSLPASIRDNSLVAIGNHDMYSEFAPHGPKSKDDDIAAFYEKFGAQHKDTDYVVHLSEWLSLIVLNTTIFGLNSLGLSQDRIDWLEDQLNGLRDKAVIVASHHPIYPISIVPPLMNAYLMTRTHFRHARSAARYQLQNLFARHPQVKLVLSGHYHGVCVDQFKKKKTAGSLPDDIYTTHIQVPCLIEYPCGYRLLKIRRQGAKCTIEYRTAFTRLHELREESRSAPIFQYLGTETRVPPRYKAAMDRPARQENFSAHLAIDDPYDLIDLNVRGFKDGTANRGLGNTGKPNINGKIEFSV
ncbi:MAG: metallophosphoesterase, partial [bacterium]